MATGRGILIFLRDLIFPPRCISCRKLLDWHLPGDDESDALCPTCFRAWESETLETCGICAKRVTECTCMTSPMERAKCRGFCKSVYYTPHRREPVQNKLIYCIKNQNNSRVSYFLAAQLLGSVERLLKDEEINRSDVILTYLPRRKRNRLKYGVDQAEHLAHELSRLSGIPVKCLLMREKSANREQKRLSRIRRMQNVKNAFLPVPDADCRGKTVLLVDDLVTTGAGMSACIKVLRRMGAKAVFCAAVAVDACNKDLPAEKNQKNMRFLKKRIDFTQ